MSIAKVIKGAIAFQVTMVTISTIQAMDLHFQRDGHWELRAEDEIGIKIDDKSNTKALLFVEQRENVKITREIAWTLPHICSKIAFSEFEIFNLFNTDDNKEDGIKKELDALTFKDITLHLLEIADSDIIGPNPTKRLFFMVPISNGLSFLFQTFDDGFSPIFNYDFKKFKRKATKHTVKSLTFPVFYGNHWQLSPGSADIKTRKKALSHLTYPSSAKISSSVTGEANEKLKEVDEIILSKPFTVAIIGTLYGKSYLLEQLTFHNWKS